MRGIERLRYEDRARQLIWKREGGISEYELGEELGIRFGERAVVGGDVIRWMRDRGEVKEVGKRIGVRLWGIVRS